MVLSGCGGTAVDWSWLEALRVRDTIGGFPIQTTAEVPTSAKNAPLDHEWRLVTHLSTSNALDMQTTHNSSVKSNKQQKQWAS